MRLLYFLILCVFTSSCVLGPLGTSKRAIKQLEKGEYNRSQKLVSKAIEKDSLLPAALYAKSRLLVSYESPEFYDSAYYFILKAQNIFDTLATKEKEKHIKQGFDSLTLHSLKTTIDSLAFEQALRENSEEGFNKFLEKHPAAKQVLLAKSRRNALAFAKAREENTYQGYKEFMETYPEAVQVAEARERYEKLYFNKSTADDKVTSYIRFLEKHPETPFRKEAEQKIFEVITSEHSMGGYQLFLKNYPKSHLRQKAINFAYHVAKAENTQIPGSWVNDSLRQVRELEPYELLAFMEDSKFGFMDDDTKTVIKPKYTSVADSYKCKATQDDFLIADNKLMGRNQAIITTIPFEDIIDLGYGLLAVKTRQGWGILHKSGERLVKPEYDQVKLLNGNILAIKKGQLWRLQTVSGRQLVSEKFDDLFEQGGFLIFEKGDLFEIKIPKQLMAAVDNSLMRFEYLYNDFELLSDGKIWLRSDYGETILDKQLQEVIPYDRQTIEFLKNGYLVRKEDQTIFYNNSYNQQVSGLSDVSVNDSWITANQDSLVMVYRLKAPENPIKADSTQLLGHSFLKIAKGDSTWLYFDDDGKLLLRSKAIVQLISQAETEYIVVMEDKTTIYNREGVAVISGDFESLNALGKEYLVFTKRNKKGAIDTQLGKVVVEPKLDAIGNYMEGNISLLKNEKFGLFHQKSGKIIPPEYDKNLSVYNDSILIGQKRDKQFLLTPGNTSLSKEGFDDIKYWSDTVAFVKNEADWQFFNLKDKILSDLKFQSFNLHELPGNEVLAVIYADSKYGILSNMRGEIIAPTFNDLIILPTGGKPLFFTEKHIKEAAFYVVIYYDIAGNVLKKQAYEAKDYDRLYCDN